MIKRLTNILQSNSGEYSLWVEVKPSNLENYFDIRFFSKYTRSNDPDKEQTRWKTTLTKDAIQNLVNIINEVTN
jgi:hypothetical protein